MAARPIRRMHAMLAAPMALLLAACAGSLRPVPVATAPPSDAQVKVWVTGRSNLQRFRCHATEANLQIDRTPGGAGALVAGTATTPYAVLRVPSAGLDCGIALMNQHLREAVHADEAPVIIFRLMRVMRGVDAEGRPAFRLVGALHLAGQERPVEIDAHLVGSASGETVIEGSHDIDIRDFGIEPPRRFLGLVRVRNQVTVHYTLALPDGA